MCRVAHECIVHLFVVEKEQSDYQRNRRMSAIDLSRGALKTGNQKDKVSLFAV